VSEGVEVYRIDAKRATSSAKTTIIKAIGVSKKKDAIERMNSGSAKATV
jgi:hypothetical protein